jgi:3-methyladenine DNA glycosylase/8-oxoguanine DNA glycosylase
MQDSARLLITPSEIVAPHDFGFQLRHYVIAPEAREGDTLVEVLRLGSGRLVRAAARSTGTVDEPALELTIDRPAAGLSRVEVDEARAQMVWRLGLDDDLRPFYALAAGDPVLTAAIAHNYGAKAKCSFTMFDSVLDVICAQNTGFRRLYAMRANLAAAFGDRLEAGPDGRTYYASPTPEQLAAAPLEAIRACGVGYRDRFIKGVAETVVGGFDIEALRDAPRAEAEAELVKLPGVGPYTVALALTIGSRRQDVLYLDVFMRQVLQQLYFAGEPVDDATLRRFADERWGTHQGYAWLYLSTNTETWARTIGIELRQKSGALSDPD